MKPSFLFIDDDKMVLEGIRRVLFRHRAAWDLDFAVGGSAGLDAVRRRAYDVVVTDIRMPDVDGIAVLEFVRQHHPDTVRLVLSGHSDLEQSLRSIQLAHQYLCKPCEPVALIALLEDLTQLVAVLRTATGGAGIAATLPPCPQTYLEVSRALEDGESLVRVGAVVGRDVASSALMLKVTNSAFLGMRREVNSVSRAVQILGARTTRAIVLAAGAVDSMGPQPRDCEAFQRHALDVATIARIIHGGDDDALLTAAFLHELGGLFAHANGLPAERQLNAADIGGFMLGLWGLPLRIVDGVANHARPGRSGQFGVPEKVHIADWIAHQVNGAARWSPQPELDEVTLELAGGESVVAEWRRRAEAALFGAVQ